MGGNTPTPLEQTIALVDSTCATNGLHYAIIGGIAATIYGSGRTTIDVDLIVQADLPSIDDVFRIFTVDFTPLKPDPLEFFRKYYVLPLTSLSSRVKIDVSAALSGFEQSALNRAARKSFGSASALFCSVEDLILFKLVANRERDLIDVRDIVLRNRERLDTVYLRSVATQFVEVGRSDIVEHLEKLIG